MERFSRFKDPLTGINQFITHKHRPITPRVILRALLFLPVYILYKLGCPTLGLILKIKRKGVPNPTKLIYANSVTQFDKDIIKGLYGIKIFSENGLGTRVIFPEGARTNNIGILRYDCGPCDFVIGLRYSAECIHIPFESNETKKKCGNELKWLIRLLGYPNMVHVNCLIGSDLPKAAGLPQLTLDSRDQTRFLKQMYNAL